MRFGIPLILVAFILPTSVQAQWVVQRTFTGNTLLDLELDPDFSTSGRGWILSQQDTLFWTVDGAGSWSPIPFAFTGNQNAVKFLDKDNGMMIGTSGRAWRSLNGGQTWNATTATGVAVTLIDVACVPSTSRFWAIGAGETIIHTPNFGTSWSTQHTGANILTAVDFVAPANGFAVGTSGTILATTDGGTTWTPRSNPAGSKTLNDVVLLTPSTGWAIGDGGTILSTVTGGSSWTLRTPGVTNNLRGVSFADSLNGVVAGENGVILHTIDGGATWASEGSGSEIYVKVHYEDIENCWIIGNAGTLLYSRGSLAVNSPNGGETIEGGSSVDITWTSRYIGQVRIEFTTDGGANWLTPGSAAMSWPASTGRFPWTVPDNISSSNCKVRVTPITKSSLVDASNQTFTIYVPDSTPPSIVCTPVAESLQGSSVLVTADITDVNGIASATLHYRLAGQTTFTSVAMTSSGGSGYGATIPWSADGIRGFQYYISAIDASFNTNSSTCPELDPETNPLFTPVRITNLSRSVESSVPESQVYQMISVPLDFNGNLGSIDSVLVDDMGPYDRKQWALFRWITANKKYSEYKESAVGSFEPGVAFWIASRRSGFTVSGGLSVSPENFDVDLEPSTTDDPLSGWHQFASPFAFDVSWSDVLAASGNPAGWDIPYHRNPATNNYEVATVLEPWTGYFFKNPGQSSTKMVIPPIESSVASAPSIPGGGADDGNSWALQLVVESGGTIDSFNYLGVGRTARRQRDPEDHLEPPTIGRAIQLFFPHRDWTRYPDNYTTDFRPPYPDGEIWDLVVTSNLPEAEATLIVHGVESVPEEFQVDLVDNAFQVVQNLRESNVYRFRAPASGERKSLQLAVARREFLEDHGIDGRSQDAPTALYQNAPNPFTPPTVIRYTLKDAARVTLDVYNAKGERINSLVKGDLVDPGVHVVLWNGRSENGEAVASGIYFYRLTAGTYTETRRMLILR